MPEQIAPLARRLGITIDELFHKYLTIDAVLIEEQKQMKAVYVLAPAIVGQRPGTVSDPTARGTCLWFTGGACQIHEAKPRECQFVDHTTTPQSSDLLRASILREWVSHKPFVQQLYGKKLKAPEALKKEYREIKRQRRSRPPTD